MLGLNTIPSQKTIRQAVALCEQILIAQVNLLIQVDCRSQDLVPQHAYADITQLLRKSQLTTIFLHNAPGWNLGCRLVKSYRFSRIACAT